jgi:hypothetical protein
MVRHWVMIGACIPVAGAMVVLLIWFFRRLNRIEEARWGQKK